MEGETVCLSFSLKRSLGVMSAGHSRTVFIGNLPWMCSNNQLADFLGQVGTVIFAEVQRYEDTKRSKGWGLAQFGSHEDALRAVHTLDRADFNGRLVHMRLDRTNTDSSDGGASVYVGNLAWSVNDRKLLSAFAPFNPLSCHVLTNMYGRSRGFALVKFLDDEVAAHAIRDMNQVELEGRRLEVRFFFWQRSYYNFSCLSYCCSTSAASIVVQFDPMNQRVKLPSLSVN